MKKSFEKEKGIFIPDKNSFKIYRKAIRNLTRISFRLLNLILYSHLFFAKLIANKSDFDECLQKGMKWGEILNERRNLNIKIDSIEKFMNYIFVNLFPILNKEETIDKYDNLVKIENKIQKLIKEFIKNRKDLIEDGD